MDVSSETKSWTDELASLVDDPVVIFPTGGYSSTATFSLEKSDVENEDLKEQIKGFAKAWGEMVMEFGRGCRDVVQQNILTDDSYIVKKTSGTVSEVSERLRFLNEFLPEDRDPVHVWPVILFVFILALSVLNVNNSQVSSIPTEKRVSAHPISAERILLPGGRHLAYHEKGVSADKARFSIIVPHGFLSSRLAGIPGIKLSLLEEFGVRLISYDLPGFGESDPHPNRNLNSSAMDMSHLVDSVGVRGKFWVLGFSGGSLHAWAALKYIPDKVAGAAMLSPLINPYEVSMTKEETSRTWENWTRRRKLLYYLARRLPKFLGYFYRRTFLSGKHGPLDKWLSLSLGIKDRDLVESLDFEEIWHRDVEESIRQGNVIPFMEEAVLQVSNWGFSLMDLQVQKKCVKKSIFPWLQFMYGQPECELTGFLGPIHIWQGMDDMAVPPSMTDYVARVLPTAVVHRLPEEGHFSYFFLCDECHRKIFSTIFGNPKGPLDTVDDTLTKGDEEEVLAQAESTTG